VGQTDVFQDGAGASLPPIAAAKIVNELAAFDYFDNVHLLLLLGRENHRRLMNAPFANWHCGARWRGMYHYVSPTK
jgi:hypothetical protein